MFSKALFKQSCKANGTMWAIITFAVCFMLACVMLISGSGALGDTKIAIEDTIITQEIDSSLEKSAISYYANSSKGLKEFDRLFAQNSTDGLTYLAYLEGWRKQMPVEADFQSSDEYSIILETWQGAMPEPTTDTAKFYAQNYSDSPATQENAIASAYSVSCSQLEEYIYEQAAAIDSSYTSDSEQAKEMLGSVMYVINPSNSFDDFYTSHSEKIPEAYDVKSLVAHISAGDIDEYLSSKERVEYRNDRAESGSAIFLAGNITEEENVNKMVEELSSYGVTREKYDGFGYTYDAVKHNASTTIVTYRNRLDYELSDLKAKYENGEIANEADYTKAVEEVNNELIDDIASTLLAALPQEVSDAIEEIGKFDLYSLIVGSIFYKLAGLLLPIIYMIMVANNLVAGQVDSGSMAYVLSTSVKRINVVFTQAVFMIGSLFVMFCLTTATGCVCLSFVEREDIQLTYAKVIQLNVGAFLVLFALSGLCFFTSCYFDRSKRSMAIGGGLSIFALVAAMLGLFGSPVIPSVLRQDALNTFNYTTIISFFDVISILDGESAFIWKFGILAVMGIIGYIAGSIKFTKKDLPL